MARIAWTVKARTDLKRILTWITHEASLRTAIKWGAKLREGVSVLETLPEIGSPVEDVPFAGLRERLIGPYRIIYSFDGTECRILTVVRAERDLRRVIAPEDFE